MSRVIDASKRFERRRRQAIQRRRLRIILQRADRLEQGIERVYEKACMAHRRSKELVRMIDEGN